MENVQRDIMAVLLRRLFERGLISEAVYHSAGNFLACSMDKTEALKYPACRTEEATMNGDTQAAG